MSAEDPEDYAAISSTPGEEDPEEDYPNVDTAFDARMRACEEKIEFLRQRVSEYEYMGETPELPVKPDGELRGVAFIYDHDRDDRVLLAIDQLYEHPCGLVALAEREGCVDVYSRLPLSLHYTEIDVCDDCWSVTNFVAYRGEWVEVTEKFVFDCVKKVLFEQRKINRKVASPAWQTDAPTQKQLEYLRSLGYVGEQPGTKLEAGKLIGEYREQR